MSAGKWHLVCNAHLDPVWLWRYEEGASEALSTFRAAADFCEEFDGFVFNHNESILYEWVEENEPALFKRIQKLVKEGKWNIIGGWYLQPDCNMPQGESFVRQIIWGRRYFKEKFGVVPQTAINFDSFGHSRGLVQVLQKSGYDSYIVCRPDKNNFPFKDADFVWRGYDGSEVVVHRSDENYNSIKGQVKEELIKFLDEHKETKTGLFLWGVGNHGGGPSRKDLNGIKELMGERDEEISHSTPFDYFSDVMKDRENMPVVERGLNPVAAGCYTAQIRIKQKHRKLENDIYTVEKMASAAVLQGLCKYPVEEIREAVRDMLFAEFHDALPGSGVKPVEEDTLRTIEHGLEITSRLKMRLFFALCSGQEKLDPSKYEVPYFLYNPHPYPVTGEFECCFVLPKQNWNVEFSYPVATQNGVKIPCQAEIEDSNFYMDWCKRAVISATLEPSSMNRVDFSFDIMPKKPEPVLPVEDGCFVFKAGKVEARVNTTTGYLDKYAVDGVDYLKPGAMKLLVLSDTYNPWGCGNDRYNAGEGVFEIMTPEEGSEFSGLREVIPSVRVVEGGDVRYIVESLLKYKNSKCVLRYIFNKQSSEIGIEADIFYGEKTKMVKLCVPTVLENAVFTGQTAFGREELKADGSEKVAQAFAAVADGESAVRVVNDGTYGCDMKDGEMRFTLLRSAGYSAADFVLGKTLSEPRYYPRMEQGERVFRFWLLGGGGEILLNADADAALHNQPPYGLPFCPSGDGEKPLPLVTVKSENDAAQLSAFKLAETGTDKYIVRVYHSLNSELTAVVGIPALDISETISFAPFEVKTFVVDAAARTFSECGMVDEALGL